MYRFSDCFDSLFDFYDYLFDGFDKYLNEYLLNSDYASDYNFTRKTFSNRCLAKW